jgi:hypothetical protein
MHAQCIEFSKHNMHLQKEIEKSKLLNGGEMSIKEQNQSMEDDFDIG